MQKQFSTVVPPSDSHFEANDFAKIQNKTKKSINIQIKTNNTHYFCYCSHRICRKKRIFANLN